MSTNIKEHDAKVVLTQLTRESRAKAILRKRTSAIPYILTASAGVGICSFLFTSSGFEAPIVIQTLLIMGCIGGILSVIDNFTTRRKLDAAIDLLLLQEERLNK